MIGYFIFVYRGIFVDDRKAVYREIFVMVESCLEESLLMIESCLDESLLRIGKLSRRIFLYLGIYDEVVHMNLASTFSLG